MVTVTVPGVLPVVGETVITWPPVVVVALAVKIAAPPPCSDTLSVCACGAAPPIWKLIGDTEAGVTTIVGEAGGGPPPTVRFTWNVAVADVVVTVTVPVYVPAPSPVAFMPTCTLPATLALNVGTIQFVEAVAPEIATGAPFRVMLTFCVVVDPPTCTLKFAGFGLAANPVVPPPPPPNVSVTGT